LLAIVGHSALDRTAWPDGRRENLLGGAPRFASRALAGTGAAVVLTKGGDDELRAPLHATGLQVLAGPSRRTTTYDVRLHGDGTWHETLAALGDRFTPHDVETWMAPALEGCSAVVCGSLWRGDFPPATLAALGRGRTLYLDAQGPGRAPRVGPVVIEGPLWRAGIAGVRVLKMNEHEARVLLGEVDLTAAESTGVPVVVVTLGERGAVVFADGVATTVPAEPVAIADTVGTGDAFLALMAAAELAGAGPVEAVRHACDGVAAMLWSRRVAEAAAESGAA
jgi:sugar/nucleoside kinase (ribokinase family)